jgi:hypothetical protein
VKKKNPSEWDDTEAEVADTEEEDDDELQAEGKELLSKQSTKSVVVKNGNGRELGRVVSYTDGTYAAITVRNKCKGIFRSSSAASRAL